MFLQEHSTTLTYGLLHVTKCSCRNTSYEPGFADQIRTAASSSPSQTK